MDHQVNTPRPANQVSGDHQRPTIATRFSDQTGVFFRYFSPARAKAFWQHVDMNDDRGAQIGPQYRSKDELLADNENYLRRAGWLIEERKLPLPSKYRDGTEHSPIGLEVEQLPLLGVARIDSVGTENIYVVKDDVHYYCKVEETEDYAEGEWDFVHRRKPLEIDAPLGAVPAQRAKGIPPDAKLTSRALAERYPVKGSMPLAVVQRLYQLRESEVEALALRNVISLADLIHLDRGARAVVAGMLYERCDSATRHALLHDEHPHVRSFAAGAKSDMENRSQRIALTAYFGK